MVTPFFTHVNKNDEACGILVNRGWLPWDLKDFRYDRLNDITTMTGILYRGDAEHKYTKPNAPFQLSYNYVKPSELALVSRLPNEEEAS